MEGSYNVGEVTVELGGEEIIKGPSASGELVRIGNDRGHFTSQAGAMGDVTRNRIHDARRPVVLIVERSSPSDAFLARARHDQEARTLVVRRLTGACVFEGHAFFEPSPSPRDIGNNTRAWELVAVGK